MQPLPLEVNKVSKSFGGGFSAGRLLPWAAAGAAPAPPRAVDAVSFHVDRGEIYGIIGANGSGKSTLVPIVSTLLLPDEGDVRIFRLDAVREPGRGRHFISPPSLPGGGLAHIFGRAAGGEPGRVRHFINRGSPDPAFFKNMSTNENLLFFGRIYGMNRRQIAEAAPRILGRLSFEYEKAGEPMSHLSRGQQQKVALGRSFLTSPALMLLDEPTTGLDPRSKRDVQQFIRDIRGEHDATILLTTHDMDQPEILS